MEKKPLHQKTAPSAVPLPAKIGFLIVMGIWLSYSSCFGQSQISGTLADQSGAPLPYANVLLLSPSDSLLVLGAVSEVNGQFKFDWVAPDKYLLSVSMIGFTSHYEILEVASGNILLSPILLDEADEELEEVVVTAKKPLYERQIDRMVINVQESITAAGNTVLEVLQKSPGVTLNRQSNTLLLNGKGGVMVMINNKLTRLPMEALFQMIEGMSAANVEKIELITNPPSKYDAEGTGGIIHIITQESEDMGTNGNFGLMAGKNARETFGANFNLNHRKDRFSFFMDYSILHNHNIDEWTNNLQVVQPDFTARFSSVTDRFYTLTFQNFRAGAEFQISKKTSVGTMVTFSKRNYNMDAASALNNNVTPDSSLLASIAIQETNIWNHFTSNINLTYNLGEKSQLRLDLDYLYSHNHNPSSYLNDFFYPERNLNRRERIDIRKSTPIHIQIATLDYTLQPTESVSLEAGIKGSVSNFVNDVGVTFTENGRQRVDPELTDIADLDEKINAAYISADWTINETNQVKAGIRYEHTRTLISTLEEDRAVDRNFGNFFPTFFYKKIFSDKINLHVGYSRRITRPTFFDMAPFVYIVDPNTFFSGNPALRPAVIDAYKLEATIKRAVIAFDYSNSKNEIANFQPEFDPSLNRQILRSQNLDFLKLYGITLSLPWIITEWWELQANAGGFYREIRTLHLEENETRTFFNYNFNIVNTIQLPKEYSLEIGGFYESKILLGLFEFLPLGSLNLGLQKKLPQNGGTLRLSVEDMLYTNVWRIQSHIPEANLFNDLRLDFHAQAFRINYSKTFGNKKLKSVDIKSASDEERRRVQ